MNHYGRGRNLEYEVKHIMQAAGWECIRGSSSKGQVLDWKADLVFSKWTDKSKREAWMVIVQCKLEGVK